MAPPSIWRIVKTDMVALYGATASPVCVVLAGIGAMGWLPNRMRFEWMDTESAYAMLAMAGIALLVAIPLILWRVTLIRAALAGEVVEGVITKLVPFRDRAYVHYRYAAGTKTIHTKFLMHQTAVFKTLRPGQTVQVGVIVGKPHSGFILELFREA